MLTDKQLEFALGEVQGMQKKHHGKSIGISIITGSDTREFIAIVEYGFERLENGNCKSLEKEFEFKKALTEDQCVDYLQDIEKLSNI